MAETDLGAVPMRRDAVIGPGLGGGRRPGAWKSTLLKIGLAATTFAVGLLILEAGARLARGRRLVSLSNYLIEDIDLLRSAYPVQFDAELGWIPRVGARGSKNHWGTRVTITDEGLRSNGDGPSPPPSPRPLVLAVGDSFTFGDEVSDSETWPAQLEALLGRRVLNAGVFGYGLDQIVLRAEALIPKTRPDLVVVGLFTEDISRCELAMRTGINKPYFELADDGLVLKNRPVSAPTASLRDPGWARRLLGHSFLVHKLMTRLMPEAWLMGTGFRGVRRAHTHGDEVGRRLIRRLARVSRDSGCHVLIVSFYPFPLAPESGRPLRPLLDCARAEGLAVLDLWGPLRGRLDQESSNLSIVFNRQREDSHLSPAGNRFVAERVREYLGRRPDLLAARPAGS
jgi:hypothetical protein